jgi:hypothetical protein
MKHLFHLFACFLISGLLSAQSDQVYSKAYLNETNGPGYVGPFSDVVSANLNTQLFPFAQADSSIRFHLGVIGTRAFVPASMETHMGMTEGLTPNQQVQVPTIFGKNESVLIEDNASNLYIFPGGFALNQLTFLVPQVSVAGLMNTDISFRFFTWNFDDDFEDLSLLGLAVRHHLGDYLSLDSRYDLSVGYAYNHIEADANTIDNKSHLIFTEAAYVGNKWRVFTQVGYVKSSLAIDYMDEDITIDFQTNNTSNIRLGLGAHVDISIFSLGVQADFFKPMVASAYFGFNF